MIPRSEGPVQPHANRWHTTLVRLRPKEPEPEPLWAAAPPGAIEPAATALHGPTLTVWPRWVRMKNM